MVKKIDKFFGNGKHIMEFIRTVVPLLSLLLLLNLTFGGV